MFMEISSRCANRCHQFVIYGYMTLYDLHLFLVRSSISVVFAVTSIDDKVNFFPFANHNVNTFSIVFMKKKTNAVEVVVTLTLSANYSLKQSES